MTRLQKTVTSLMVAVTFAGFDEIRRHVGEAHMSRK